MGGFLVLGIWLVLIASVVDGMLEGYLFDGRRSFERKYDVSVDGFWGSLSWKRRYEAPNVWNKYLGVFDFYHVADDVRKYGYLIGAALFGGFIDVSLWLLVVVITSVLIAASLSKKWAMRWIRS